MTKDVYWIHGVESEAVAPVLYYHSGGTDPLAAPAGHRLVERRPSLG